MKQITIENANQLHPGDIIWHHYFGYFTILRNYYNALNEHTGYYCIELVDNFKRILYFGHLSEPLSNDWYIVYPY